MILIKVAFVLLLAVCLILLAFSIYIGERNDKVKDFKLYVLDLAFQEAQRRIDADRNDWIDVYKLCEHSYSSMLFSFKPLTLEAWFTEDEIKILKGESE